jgi:glycosyltransferase involved in cell wall biosynthesis
LTEPRIGIALVTHNAAAWLPETLDSIANQTLSAHVIAVVDDHSTDETLAVLASRQAQLPELRLASASVAPADTKSRIARNFTRAVQLLNDCELIALTDHDDIWRTDRLAHQTSIMSRDSDVWMLASNGALADDRGSLHEAFCVPAGFNALPADEALRWVIRHSVATGGASMIRPKYFKRPPDGWLHDRWWSLESAAGAALCIDPTIVIDYRVHAGQQVGLNPGRQLAEGLDRASGARAADLRRFADLHALRANADLACQPELTYRRLVRTLMRSS